MVQKELVEEEEALVVKVVEKEVVDLENTPIVAHRCLEFALEENSEKIYPPPPRTQICARANRSVERGFEAAAAASQRQHSPNASDQLCRVPICRF